MNTAQRILKNFLSLTFSDIFTKFLGIITVAYLARILGPGDFGKINFALTVVGYFAILSHFGLNVIGTREISRYKEKISDYVNNILTLKLCLGLFAYALLAIFVFLINKPTDIKYLIIFYGLTIFTASVLLFDWVFQGIEKMEYQANALILQGICYLGLILIIIKSSEQLLLIPPILVSAQLVAAVFLIAVFIKMFRMPKFEFNLSLWRFLIKNTLPIGLSGILLTLLWPLQTLLIGFLRTNEEVGYYSAAYKIILLLSGLFGVYHTVIFPRVSYYYKNSLDSLRKFLSMNLKLMVTISLPLTIGGIILARPIMELIYGDNYMQGVVVFRILILSVFLLSINNIYGRGLLACNQEKKYLQIIVILGGINLLTCIFLTQLVGIVGAAMAIILTETIALFLQYRSFSDVVKVSFLPSLIKPLLASGIMIIVLHFWRNFPLVGLLTVGTVVYSLSFWLIGGVNRDELNLVQEVIFVRKYGNNHS